MAPSVATAARRGESAASQGRITMEAFGGRVLDRELTTRVRAGQNPTPALRAIGGFLQDVQARRFQTEGAYDGRRWAPLAEHTLAARPAGQGTAILQASGQLRDSLLHGGVHASHDEMRWQTDVAYARFVNRRRPIVAVRDENRRRMLRLLSHWLRTGELQRETPR
jgi:Phage virion morphogenesis family